MASKAPVHVTVTGAAGQIGYSLLFRIASGQLLGDDQPIVLRLLEIEPALKVLEGVCMELDDGAFPLLHDIVATSEPRRPPFDGNWNVGASSWGRCRARYRRCERGDLLSAERRRSSCRRASGESRRTPPSDVAVLVVGNPCNTNCSIARVQRA